MPDLAQAGVGVKLAGMCDSGFVVVGGNPVRQIDAPRPIKAVDTVICHTPAPAR
jgi:hypothetical protein